MKENSTKINKQDSHYVNDKDGNIRKKSSEWYLLGMIGGFLLAMVGLYLQIRDYDNLNQALPGVFMGIGSGLLGGCTAGFINQRMFKKNPSLAHQKEIEFMDERNIMIKDKAKSKALSLLQYIYCGMLLLFTLLDVEITVILVTVAVLLLGNGIVVYYTLKYNKEL